MPGESGLYDADRGGQAPPDVDDEPVPQLGRVCVPQHMARVVVAVGAQGLADEGIGRVVDGPAAERAPVVSLGPVATGTVALPGTVHGPEGRSGQGDEEPGPMTDVGRDVLAAQEARADEVEGVPGVEARARCADGRASVAAADEEPFAGFGTGVVAVDDLAGCAVQGGGRAGEVDGVGAAADCGDLLQPAGELRILGDADRVSVGFGELTQARRAVQGGAPVSRGELGCDGGDLPGWAAEAARVMVGGAQSSMGITPWVVGRGWAGSADGSGAAADAAAVEPSGPGSAGSVALAVGAPHAGHGHGVGPSCRSRSGRSRSAPR